MDDVLKRRLAGVAVLMGAVLLLSMLLPRPGAETPEGQTRRVTVNLAEAPVDNAVAAAPMPTPVPPVIAAPEAAHQSASATVSESVEPAIEEPPVAVPTIVSAPHKPEQSAPAPRAATPQPASPRPQEAVKSTLRLAPALEHLPDPRPDPKAAAAGSHKPAPPKITGAAKSEAQAPKPPPAERRHWYVQAGAFTDVANARQVLVQLKAAGLPGLISPAETAGGTRYRVRLGPYASKEQAQAMSRHMGQQGFARGTVVED